MSEPNLEIPEDDAVEQRRPAGPDDEPEWPASLPEDADEGDAAEQIREVGTDEDEYR